MTVGVILLIALAIAGVMLVINIFTTLAHIRRIKAARAAEQKKGGGSGDGSSVV